MEKFPQSFKVYGFTIEVHAGGRRVWPPSFKRFITRSLDDGMLKVGAVMKTCNVSQSLVYKWRADLAKCPEHREATVKKPVFSEILVEEKAPETSEKEDCIRLRGRSSEIQLPADYPVVDLIAVIMALEAKP